MSQMFRSLERNPNYRLYFAGSVVSNTGTWMQRVAQDWLVLSLPGTGGSELGITTGLQFLPILLLSPYAGVIADRFPKRRMLQVTQASMAVTSLALGLVAVSGHAEVWMVYVLAFLFGVGAAFDAPARAELRCPRWSTATTSPTRSASTAPRSTSPGSPARRPPAC